MQLTYITKMRKRRPLIVTVLTMTVSSGTRHCASIVRSSISYTTHALNGRFLFILTRNFSTINVEDDTGVLFAFAGGATATASLLISVDGIHSKVRQYIAPNV